MKTDELIDRLGRDVTVTRPLLAPGIRTAVWMVWAVIYLVVVAVMMLAMMSSALVMPTPLFLVQQSAALVTGIMAARAALASVIPGGRGRLWVMPAIGAAVWAGSLLWAGMLDLQASGTLGATSQSDWPCVASMALGRSGRRSAPYLDVAARRSADARPHGLPRRAGRAERCQYRSVPDAASCVRTDGPPVAWRHRRRGRGSVRPQGPSVVPLA